MPNNDSPASELHAWNVSFAKYLITGYFEMGPAITSN